MRSLRVQFQASDCCGSSPGLIISRETHECVCCYGPTLIYGHECIPRHGPLITRHRHVVASTLGSKAHRFRFQQLGHTCSVTNPACLKHEIQIMCTVCVKSRGGGGRSRYYLLADTTDFINMAGILTLLGNPKQQTAHRTGLVGVSSSTQSARTRQGVGHSLWMRISLNTAFFCQIFCLWPCTCQLNLPLTNQYLMKIYLVAATGPGSLSPIVLAN